MPNNYKVNIFFAAESRFTGQVPAGWSETYYTSQSSLDLALTAASNLAIQRALVLAFPCTIIGYRASQLGGMRISQLGPPQDYTLFNTAATADTPWQAALVHLVAVDGYSRPLMVRGIPDSVYNPDGAAEIAEQVAWYAALNNFITATLVGGPWYIYAISKDFVTYPQLPILDITQPGAGILQVVTTVPHGLVIGGLVKLYSSGIRPVPGVHKVIAVPAANTFTTVGTLQAGWTLPLAAYARSIVKNLFGISGGTVERITHRITGRPFGLQRGKRRTTA